MGGQAKLSYRRKAGSKSLFAATLIAALAFGAHPASTETTSLASAATIEGARAPLPGPGEMDKARVGLSAAASGDWITLERARTSASDPLVRKILAWRAASDQDSALSFDELSAALSDLQGWPGRETMRRRAEQAIFDSSLSPQARVEWLQREDGPLTGDGQTALAIAYAALGKSTEARDLARRTWRTRNLGSRAQSELLGRFGEYLTSEDNFDRVDGLLWRDDRSAAAALLHRLDSGDRRVAEARIALQARKAKGLQKVIDRVPMGRRDDAGLLYDRARYVRRAGRPEDALDIVARIKPLSAPLDARETLLEERRLYVPRALRRGDQKLAYRLVSDHGVASGVQFADGEWLAGWVALRFLKNPTLAATHFERLESNVTAPISKARALYWRAQASKAQGEEAKTQALLTQAAALSYTYYGQLAASQLSSPPPLSLGDAPAISAAERGAFEQRELVRALRVIAQVSDLRDFERVAYYLDDQIATASEHEMLAAIAREAGYARTAVRTAKAGLQRGVVASRAAYPTIPIPASAKQPGFAEPALVYAISRQESEFDPQAMSPVGARGLMQLMPATAQITARHVGVTYEKARLFETDYNMTLGAAHLGELVGEFNGSYVMAIAAYNAGASRPRQWMEDWGDPRSGAIDIVDWIELIPFGETRNYVQRVLENLQVYRHRLAGTPTPITLKSDLRRGFYADQ